MGIRVAKARPSMKVIEWVGRYTESAVLSAVRLKRYWIGQGNSEKEATSKALNQALGMIVSGNPERSVELLREIEQTSKALRELVKSSVLPTLKKAKSRE